MAADDGFTKTIDQRLAERRKECMRKIINNENND
jgi:hypothetical protein